MGIVGEQWGNSGNSGGVGSYLKYSLIIGMSQGVWALISMQSFSSSFVISECLRDKRAETARQKRRRK